MNGDTPAFPRPLVAIPGEGFEEGQAGMTKREWFAGMAMQGLVISCIADVKSDESAPTDISKAAFNLADAMLAAAKIEPR